MDVQLIKQFARIDIGSMAKDVIAQWRKQGAIKADDIVAIGVQQEGALWYITFRVVDKQNK